MKYVVTFGDYIHEMAKIDPKKIESISKQIKTEDPYEELEKKYGVLLPIFKDKTVDYIGFTKAMLKDELFLDETELRKFISLSKVRKDTFDKLYNSFKENYDNWQAIYNRPSAKELYTELTKTKDNSFDYFFKILKNVNYVSSSSKTPTKQAAVVMSEFFSDEKEILPFSFAMILQRSIEEGVQVQLQNARSSCKIFFDKITAVNPIVGLDRIKFILKYEGASSATSSATGEPIKPRTYTTTAFEGDDKLYQKGKYVYVKDENRTVKPINGKLMEVVSNGEPKPFRGNSNEKFSYNISPAKLFAYLAKTRKEGKTADDYKKDYAEYLTKFKTDPKTAGVFVTNEELTSYMLFVYPQLKTKAKIHGKTKTYFTCPTCGRIITNDTTSDGNQIPINNAGALGKWSTVTGGKPINCNTICSRENSGVLAENFVFVGDLFEYYFELED